MIAQYPWLNSHWKNIQCGNLKTFQPLLIAGAAGRGQWVLAQRAAKAFLCESQEKPCGFCFSCAAFDSKTHPDLWYLSDDGDSISIDVTRLINDHTHQKPMRSEGARVVLIEHFDRATVAAQQALLKVFEEPFVKTAFVVTARSVDRVLPTLRSRMALLNIPPVSRELFQQWCAQQSIAYQDWLYDLADGSPLFLQDLDLVKLNDLKVALHANDFKAVAMSREFNRPVFYALAYQVLAERAKHSMSMLDFERLDQWQALYAEAGLSKSMNWDLQCRSFFHAH